MLGMINSILLSSLCIVMNMTAATRTTTLHTVSSEMIDALLADWIGQRDMSTFVFRNEETATGWDKTDRSDAAYSEILTGGKNITDLDLLTQAYRLCTNRLSGMLPGKGLKLSFHPDQSFTDGKHIFVGTDVVDYGPYTAFQKTDVMLGLTVHEALHVLLTDFNRKFFHSKFQHTILNIIEDERIEHACGNLFPGYAAWLEKTKAYYFDAKYQSKELSDEFNEVFDCFFKFVRFPKYVDRHLASKHIQVLTEIKAILSPYPETFIEAYQASVKVSQLFKATFNQLADKMEQEGKSEELRKLAQTDSSGPLTDTAMQEIVESLLDRIGEMMSDLNSPNTEESAARISQCAETILDSPINALIVSGECSLDISSSTYFLKAENTRTGYQQLRKHAISAARILANAIQSDLGSRPKALFGMKEGLIDENRIAELSIGVSNTYKQNQPSPAQKITIVLMLDESGSMLYGTKMLDAALTATIVNEALMRIKGASLFIYGYTSDHGGKFGTDQITIYKEPGLKRDFALGSVVAKSNNRDGRCIRTVAKRVRKFTSDPALFFVVSDGQPHAIDYDNGINDTAEAIRSISRDNFHPIQIGIAVDTKVQSRMYKDFINYSDSKSMVHGVSKLLRKKIQKLIT